MTIQEMLNDEEFQKELKLAIESASTEDWVMDDNDEDEVRVEGYDVNICRFNVNELIGKYADKP